MRYVPAGRYRLGAEGEHAGPDEGPVHEVAVQGFWIDRTEVTNRQFREFVDSTGYVTTAEQEVPPEDVPGLEEPLPAGSQVFAPPPASPDESVDNIENLSWWRWAKGACWRHPEGPDSDLEGRWDHPVVQVSWHDARAYARWAGKRLPTEAEWEIAARGGLVQAGYVWGDERRPGGGDPANLWQGSFPVSDLAADGFHGTAPVGRFPPNGYDLVDMSGNVWEWCEDLYHPRTFTALEDGATDPTGPSESYDPLLPGREVRVLRGGSFLCNDSYCRGYRPSARMKSTPDTGLPHTGFRCVSDAPAPR